MDIKFFLSTVAAIAIATQTLFAQSSGIQGKVMDASDQSLVFYANVLLLDSDSTFVAGVNSNREGIFEFKNIPAGNYILSASFMGYKTAYLPFHSQENSAFVQILLNPSEIALGEVTIQARSVIQKADRTLLFPSETQVKASTGGMDLLQKLQLPLYG